MSHVHLTILISARWSATSFSFLTGQVSIHATYYFAHNCWCLPFIVNDISKLVCTGTNCSDLLHPLRIVSSAAVVASPSMLNYLNSKTYFRFALAPVFTFVWPVLVTGFKHPLQIKVFITLDMLPFMPLHFLCTHCWQIVHCIELLPTPLPQNTCPKNNKKPS